MRHDALPERLVQSCRHMLNQLTRLDLGERLQGHGGEVLLPPTPGGTAIE